tara:strand:+ start:28 stop:465 length:438 start_codon:yes stop_codon:yes gene_type:complete
MELFNTLSYNLQDITLQKIFKSNNKSLLLDELNGLISEYNKLNQYSDITFYKYLFYEQIGLCGDKCDYCKSYANDRGFFQFFDDYPFYEKAQIKDKTYKYKKKFKSYWMNHISSSSIRCSFSYNYLCYGCYFGYSKKPSKFFIYL